MGILLVAELVLLDHSTCPQLTAETLSQITPQGNTGRKPPLFRLFAAGKGGGSNWAVGATVGIVVAGVALLMACVAFGLLVLRRRKRNRERSTDFETG